MKTKLKLCLGLLVFVIASLFTNVARANDEVQTVRTVIARLPGVRDEGHLQDVAQGIVSASYEATCTGDWKVADWCRASWTGERRALVALLITVGYWESKFTARIGYGRCLSYECDAYKDAKGRVRHRARGYFQVQYTSAIRPVEWYEMVGKGDYPAFVASSVAARLLGRHLALCNNIPGALSGYATGGRCEWSRAMRRMSVYHKAMIELSTSAPASAVATN